MRYDLARVVIVQGVQVKEVRFGMDLSLEEAETIANKNTRYDNRKTKTVSYVRPVAKSEEARP